MLFVTGVQWRVVLTRRGMLRLSQLLPEWADSGGPLDDLDAWLDVEGVPDGVPFLVSPSQQPAGSAVSTPAPQHPNGRDDTVFCRPATQDLSTVQSRFATAIR